MHNMYTASSQSARPLCAAASKMIADFGVVGGKETIHSIAQPRLMVGILIFTDYKRPVSVITEAAINVMPRLKRSIPICVILIPTRRGMLQFLISSLFR